MPSQSDGIQQGLRAAIDDLDAMAPDHERCACWWHGDRRIDWTEEDFCPQHPDDHVLERRVWEDERV